MGKLVLIRGNKKPPARFIMFFPEGAAIGEPVGLRAADDHSHDTGKMLGSARVIHDLGLDPEWKAPDGKKVSRGYYECEIVEWIG